MISKKFHVTALGEAMVEFNQTDPGQPHYLQGFGGDTSNAVIAAARAGACTAYLSRLGEDTFSELLRDLWQREQVNIEAVDTDQNAPTGIYFVTHTNQGHAFTYRRAGSAACQMSPEWLAGIPARVIEQSQWLHLSGISLAISEQARETAFIAMRIAKNAGTLIAFDSNLRLKLWTLEQARIAMLAAINACDLFLPSMDDMTALTGLTDPQAIINWSHAQGVKKIVLKLGASGCLVSDQASGAVIHVPGINVNAVDATGAGDCFCGNLLARLSMHDDLLTATRYANVAASLAVQGFGAVSCLPYADEVQETLSSL